MTRTLIIVTSYTNVEDEHPLTIQSFDGEDAHQKASKRVTDCLDSGHHKLLVTRAILPDITHGA